MHSSIRNSQSGFTLLELLAAIAVAAILSMLVIPQARDSMIRAQVVKSQTDMAAIENALHLYHADYSIYPNTRLTPMTRGAEIHKLACLTTPVAYLSDFPFLPWYGETGRPYAKADRLSNGDIQNKVHSNYIVWVSYSVLYESDDNTLLSNPLPDWMMFSGGPVSVYSGADPGRWFSPTNGMRSEGGFWLDSDGSLSFKTD
ncbi:MAG: prepilin-type N-terminal cleavage/methylation domain-containing protein [Candidatus Omnitrophica bacterium]|nr:prepilin-type N-terminal cleavage/methylation domain-containing protein [Candidatus Omnitrophota bacterium]